MTALTITYYTEKIVSRSLLFRNQQFPQEILEKLLNFRKMAISLKIKKRPDFMANFTRNIVKFTRLLV